jgi:transposase
LLRRTCHAVNLARERGSPLKPRLIALIGRRYDAFVTVLISVISRVKL